MKQIDYRPTYSYSCAVCGQGFNSNEELLIIPYKFPVCSKKCLKNVIYSILSSYDDLTLISLHKTLIANQNTPLTRNNLLINLTSCYVENIKINPKPTLNNNSTAHSTPIIAQVLNRNNSTAQVYLLYLCYVLFCAMMILGGYYGF